MSTLPSGFVHPSLVTLPPAPDVAACKRDLDAALAAYQAARNARADRAQMQALRLAFTSAESAYNCARFRCTR